MVLQKLSGDDNKKIVKQKEEKKTKVVKMLEDESKYPEVLDMFLKGVKDGNK